VENYKNCEGGKLLKLCGPGDLCEVPLDIYAVV